MITVLIVIGFGIVITGIAGVYCWILLKINK